MMIVKFYNLCRHPKLPTRVQIVFMVSFAVLNAIVTGAVEIHGLTWDKSAWIVTPWCIPMNSANWKEEHIHVSLYLRLKRHGETKLITP